MRIIKKKPGAVIDHPIGKSFRGHNLVEYKSPSDTLSIDAFSKAVSYAYLYKSQGETENAVPFQEMTLTFIPKIVCMFIALLLALPWLMERMITFTRDIFINIPVFPSM